MLSRMSAFGRKADVRTSYIRSTGAMSKIYCGEVMFDTVFNCGRYLQRCLFRPPCVPLFFPNGSVWRPGC